MRGKFLPFLPLCLILCMQRWLLQFLRHLMSSMPSRLHNLYLLHCLHVLRAQRLYFQLPLRLRPRLLPRLPRKLLVLPRRLFNLLKPLRLHSLHGPQRSPRPQQFGGSLQVQSRLLPRPLHIPVPILPKYLLGVHCKHLQHLPRPERHPKLRGQRRQLPLRA